MSIPDDRDEIIAIRSAEMDEMRRRREGLRQRREEQFDRYVGWIFSLAFLIVLIVAAVGAAAARWLYLACTL